MDDTPFISVIICTYNREKYILPALESITSQDYPHKEYEIVLINNNSTDRTDELCRQFAEKYSDIQFCYYIETQQGLSYARNRGIVESKGELLIYIDDDATAFPGYIQAYSSFFKEHPEVMAAGGPIIPVYEETPPLWLSPFTEKLLTGHLNNGERPCVFTHSRYPSGCNTCYRKLFFEQFGLFNIELGRKGRNLIGAEEKEIFYRFLAKGNKIWYVPEAGIYHHIPPEKLTENHLRKLTYSIGVSERIRTLSLSKFAFSCKISSEIIKWSVSLALFAFYTLGGNYSKGIKLLQFRYNVMRGLLSFNSQS